MKKTETSGRIGSPKTAGELLDMYYLTMRSALLETAASLDRIDRAAGAADVLDDPRLRRLREGCDIIKEGKGGRAEEFLVLFSAPGRAGS